MVSLDGSKGCTIIPMAAPMSTPVMCIHNNIAMVHMCTTITQLPL